MNMFSSFRQQKFECFQIRCCVLEAKLQNIHHLCNPGRPELRGLHNLLFIVSLTKIDGEPGVFEWKIFPGHTPLKLLREVQSMTEKDHTQPEDFQGPNRLHVDVQRHRLGPKMQ